MHYNLRKHFFSNIIVAVWNSLRNIVVSAESTNIFWNRSDKLWINQEFKFDFCADTTGIGSRSFVACLLIRIIAYWAPIFPAPLQVEVY